MMDFERVVDEEQAEKSAEDMLSGNFNFNHFLEQIQTIQQMGSLRELFERMPFFSGMADKVNIDDSPNAPSKYGVRGIPTLLLFKDGELVSRKVGAATPVDDIGKPPPGRVYWSSLTLGDRRLFAQGEKRQEHGRGVKNLA